MSKRTPPLQFYYCDLSELLPGADAEPQFVDDIIALAMGYGGVNYFLYPNAKNNLTATTAPGVGDDSADGYDEGSLWVNNSTNTAYICVDPAAGAAVWQVVGSGTGTVTSVGLAAPAQFTVSGSPVTTSGTLTLAWADQAANLVFAGPTTGAPAVPAFRALVAADVPAHASTHQHGGSDEIATATAGANAIPKAGAGGTLDIGWIPAGVMTDAEHAADAHTMTIDGRDVSADGAKLDGVEPGADVTDATNVAAAGAVMDSDFSPGEGFLRKTGAGTYTAHKSNLAAAVAPVVTDDSAAGYSIGSTWLDTTADKGYVCLDATVGAAVWKETTGGLSAHAATHQSGGSDPIKLDDLSAPDDNTDLNATAAAHGLLKKLSGTATEFLNGAGNWSAPTSGLASSKKLQAVFF